MDEYASKNTSASTVKPGRRMQAVMNDVSRLNVTPGLAAYVMKKKDRVSSASPGQRMPKSIRRLKQSRNSSYLDPTISKMNRFNETMKQ